MYFFLCMFLCILLEGITALGLNSSQNCPSPTDPLHLRIDLWDKNSNMLTDKYDFPCLRRIGPVLSNGFGDFNAVACHREYSREDYGPWKCYPKRPGYVPISTMFEYSVECIPITEENINSAAYSHLSCSLIYTVDWSYQWIWSLATFTGTNVISWFVVVHLLIAYGSITTAALSGLYLILETVVCGICFGVIYIRDDMNAHFLGIMVSLNVLIFFFSTSAVSWLANHEYNGRRQRYIKIGTQKKYDMESQDEESPPTVRGPGPRLLLRQFCFFPFRAVQWFICGFPFWLFGSLCNVFSYFCRRQAQQQQMIDNPYDYDDDDDDDDDDINTDLNDASARFYANQNNSMKDVSDDDDESLSTESTQETKEEEEELNKMEKEIREEKEKEEEDAEVSS